MPLFLLVALGLGAYVVYKKVLSTPGALPPAGTFVAPPPVQTASPSPYTFLPATSPIGGAISINTGPAPNSSPLAGVFTALGSIASSIPAALKQLDAAGTGLTNNVQTAVGVTAKSFQALVTSADATAQSQLNFGQGSTGLFGPMTPDSLGGIPLADSGLDTTNTFSGYMNTLAPGVTSGSIFTDAASSALPGAPGWVDTPASAPDTVVSGYIQSPEPTMAVPSTDPSTGVDPGGVSSGNPTVSLSPDEPGSAVGSFTSFVFGD
jgi:hypothetical protein